MADRIAINSPQLETQPLLAKRLSARSGVLGAITGPQRLWSTLIVSVLASMTAMPGGYTLAYPSSALLDLRSINDERVFIPDSVVENLFGVSCSSLYSNYPIIAVGNGSIGRSYWWNYIRFFS